MYNLRLDHRTSIKQVLDIMKTLRDLVVGCQGNLYPATPVFINNRMVMLHALRTVHVPDSPVAENLRKARCCRAYWTHKVLGPIAAHRSLEPRHVNPVSSSTELPTSHLLLLNTASWLAPDVLPTTRLDIRGATSLDTVLEGEARW